MNVRPGRIDEVEHLAALALHFCHSGIYPLLVDATEETLIGLMLAVFQMAEAGTGGVWVAVADDGQVIGGIMAAELPQPMTQKPYADELGLWIEPNARGGRAWRLLMDAFEAWADARGLGCKMVAPHGTHVGVLYERRGYAPIESVWYRAATKKD